MNIETSLVEKLVKKVMEEMNSIDQVNNFDEYGIFNTMDEAIEAAYIAQRQYLKCSISDRERYIKAIRNVILKEENLERLSRVTVEETEMGVYEHKYIKNKLAAEKTPGTEDLVTEAMAGDDGLTLVELSPFGVIGSITPTTNPTETIISNSIGMLAAGNSVVFSPHPKSKKVSIDIITMMNKALKDEGAPANLITMVGEPSIENTNILMNHPKISMIVATGGPGIVKMAMSTGKKAIGAGAGNPPVVVDETANIEKAAKDIIDGCSFDNNIPCIAEKEVIAVDSITDYLIFNMKKSGAYEIKDKEIVDKLTKIVLDENENLNKDLVGKSAKYILKQINIEVDEDIKVIIAETDKDHPWVRHELMMPVLPIVRAKDVDEAIDIAIEAEQGNRHTAIMHSNNVEKLTKMAKLIQTTIFVKNGPSYAGIGVGGEGYTTFTIAGPTGEGLTSAKSFARKRRCVLVGGFHIK
ncbi:MAG: aldehyde dehydrogenase EutE [Tissierella sp.]|nr:aldehyde dehydrogenase EutE [Tissierella sp.]